MAIRPRKMLVLAALCWFAPAPARQPAEPANASRAGCAHEVRRIVVTRAANPGLTELTVGYRPSQIFP